MLKKYFVINMVTTTTVVSWDSWVALVTRSTSLTTTTLVTNGTVSTGNGVISVQETRGRKPTKKTYSNEQFSYYR